MWYRQSEQLAKSASILGFGCGSVGSAASKKESMRLLEAAWDAGVNVFDTADFYAQGDSERILGSFLSRKREKSVLITKAGLVWRSEIKLLSMAKNFVRPLIRRSPAVKAAAQRVLAQSMNAQNFDPAYIRQSLENSLGRLRMEHVDVFLLHNPPLGALSDELLNELGQLRKQGKARLIGISADSIDIVPELLRRCGEVINAIEVPMRFGSLEAFSAAARECCNHDIAVFAREPFASGGLFRSENIQLKAWLEQHKLALSQVVLQAIAADPNVLSIISGTTKPGHLCENIDAFSTAREPLAKIDIQEFLLLLKEGAVERA